jgi:hypothetical protein
MGEVRGRPVAGLSPRHSSPRIEQPFSWGWGGWMSELLTAGTWEAAEKVQFLHLQG